MADLWTSKLSEYVDGTLAAPDRQALERHLGDCSECRITLDDLRVVVARASVLSDTAPTTNLWPGVASRIRPAGSDVRDIAAVRRERWTIRLTIPQLAAAGIALMLMSGGLAYRYAASASAGDSSTGFGAVGVMHAGTPRSQMVFDQAVAELQQILETGRGRLDSTTIRSLETSLATIDRAIDQAQYAVMADSANGYLRDHLEQTQRRKIALMRRAADLIEVAS